MSNYICECGVSNIDSDDGYVQGCDCHAKFSVKDKYVKASVKEQIDLDIIGEIMKLRKQVKDIQEARWFSCAMFDSIVGRLNDVERRMDRTDKALLSIVELRDMRGKA